MSLQVAPCPNCGAAVVYGERRCRTCGQTFDYGATPPALPTPEQVVEALRAVGVVVDVPAPAALDDDSIFAAAAVRPALGAGVAQASTSPAPSTSAPPTSPIATALELDTGRFDGAGAVAVDEVPGLVDSTLFAAMTPDHVDVEALPGLEHTGLGGVEVASTSVGRLADLEPAGGDVGAVAVEDIPGIYHSDMFHTDVDVAAGAAVAGEMLEVSPSMPRGARRPSSPDAGWTRVACAACGTVHAAARCPNCATAHPHEPRR